MESVIKKIKKIQPIISLNWSDFYRFNKYYSFHAMTLSDYVPEHCKEVFGLLVHEICKELF